MQHPVYGELDYRKVDTSQLNPHIPKGRGMIKWAPFATMPEQFQDVRQQIENQNKITRPELSDDRLQELDIQLKEALHRQCPVLIQFYHDGYIDELTMTVERIDTWALHIIGTNHANQQMCFISFMDVINIALETI
ncbi:YolD-like family protein [Macrococcus carouselicus]|uniref:YolD-like family protein n=1 Tax=Macrococcus carouselicus TaxID=69969 RepID=A0A9Q8CKY1_9STAP|nr:YolD-like family protein [Macrococcus carouselicus]TDM00693.1 YolD-like family protein [Macrococcus carouselicus]